VFRTPDGHLTRRTTRALSFLHTAGYRLTRGRIGRRLVDNDMLLLTTTGRKSGKQRTVPLLYLRDGDALVVIASFGGHDYHPDWYLNLVANPGIDVTVDGRQSAMTARTANPEERARLWPQALAAYDGYSGYQSRTEREIPVVLLDPA